MWQRRTHGLFLLPPSGQTVIATLTAKKKKEKKTSYFVQQLDALLQLDALQALSN